MSEKHLNQFQQPKKEALSKRLKKGLTSLSVAANLVFVNLTIADNNFHQQEKIVKNEEEINVSELIQGWKKEMVVDKKNNKDLIEEVSIVLEFYELIKDMTNDGIEFLRVTDDDIKKYESGELTGIQKERVEEYFKAKKRLKKQLKDIEKLKEFKKSLEE